MDISAKVKTMMGDRNWSQRQLSTESGVPLSTINSMFHKGTQPTLPTLEGFCKAFLISMSDFFAEGDALTRDRLTEEERRFLTMFSQLPREKKEVILRFLTWL